MRLPYHVLDELVRGADLKLLARGSAGAFHSPLCRRQIRALRLSE